MPRSSYRAFRPAWWLPGAHAQTVWGRLARSRRLVAFRRESLEAPDGDELLLDHADGLPGSPRVVLLHGLEGSSSSVYLQGLARQLLDRGLSVTALNFRFCARDPADLDRHLPNRRPRLYHSGETTDLDHVIHALASREPGRALLAAGVSLGGNVLLKWLGENPDARLLRAAATVSVPYDLAAGAGHLETALGRRYVALFVKTLAPKARHLARSFPEVAARLDLSAIERARTFREFDEAGTAPLHGFASAEDYWARSSSIFHAGRIRVPTLCLSSEDDPFLPREVLSRFREAASTQVELLATRKGGHAGFLEGGSPWTIRAWAEETVAEFLAGSASQGHPPWGTLTAP